MCALSVSFSSVPPTLEHSSPPRRCAVSPMSVQRLSFGAAHQPRLSSPLHCRQTAARRLVCAPEGHCSRRSPAAASRSSRQQEQQPAASSSSSSRQEPAARPQDRRAQTCPSFPAKPAGSPPLSQRSEVELRVLVRAMPPPPPPSSEPDPKPEASITARKPVNREAYRQQHDDKLWGRRCPWPDPRCAALRSSPTKASANAASLPPSPPPTQRRNASERLPITREWGCRHLAPRAATKLCGSERCDVDPSHLG